MIASLPRLIGFRMLSLLWLALLLAGLWGRPYLPLLLPLLLLQLVVQARWPLAWLLTLPAMLPLMDWSPWSGWLELQEFDLLVLPALAVAYWQAPRQPVAGRLSPLATVLVGGLLLSWAGALVHGVLQLDPSATWLPGSLSASNVVRGAKGTLLGIAMLPLVRRAWAERETALWHYFMPGMAIGLCLASAMVVAERWLFPGLTDFASDYRAVGPFYEMFAGGAALDGYLALGLPLLLWVGLRQRHDAWLAVGAGVLGLGLYASLTTFSRGVYLGGLLSVLVMAALLLRGTGAGRRSIGVLLWLLPGIYGLLQVFHGGGYRTLAAALLAIVAALLLVATPRPSRGRPALLLAPTMLGVPAVFALFALFDKGAYLACALAALTAAAGWLWYWRAGSARGLALAWVATLALPLTVPMVGWHWGGQAALTAALAWGGYAWATLLVGRLAGWGAEHPRDLALPVVFIALSAVVVPVLGNYYMGQRFGQVSQDLQGRGQHWSDVVALVDSPAAMLLGKGVGHFVDDYYWHNRHAELPGAVQLVHEAGRNYVKLAAPRFIGGFGEVVRLSQRVSLGSGTVYFSALARSAMPDGAFDIYLCDKWLLYPFNCLFAGAGNVGTTWQPIRVMLKGERIVDGRSWLRPSQINLSTGNTNRASSIDLTDIDVTDASGRSLLKNGDFRQGIAHWTYTSDRHHLPWHAKNMWLHVYYEQGLAGVLSFCCVLAAAVASLLSRHRRDDRLAVPMLAGLIGLLAVGLFDSLLDFGRIAWLFYLVLWLSLMKSVPTAPSRAATRR
ncbi:hypothetical protein ABWL39_12050 [Chitinivorax sp. PXF-14]|uniref:hypothetical protein n=1 Tax=Chitinivorax sp. PXF-14 TaxID=3230488 RepID=UPI003466D09A